MRKVKEEIKKLGETLETIQYGSGATMGSTNHYDILFNYENGILTLDVESVLQEESKKEFATLKEDKGIVESISFNTNLFIHLGCEEIIEAAICKYFKIESVDDYSESENLNEAIRAYVIDKNVEMKKVILL